MTNIPSTSLYSDLAWVYRMISPPEDYVHECERYLAWLHKHARIPVKSLLHLGCGAGHHDFTLKKDSVVFEKIPEFKPIPFEKIGLQKDEYRK